MITSQLLHPASIVVVGASNNVHKPGGAILKNLLSGGYTGELRAVNPKETEVQGVAAFADVKDIPDTDLAILAIPAALCPDAVEMLAAEKQVKAFIILSAGFGEETHEGAVLEDRILETVNRYGASLIGPNCIGFMNSWHHSVFSQPIPQLHPQGVDLISSSGATAVFILESAVTKGLQFNSVWSVGNAKQIGVEDVLQYMDEHFNPEADSRIKLLYIESIGDPDRLLFHASSLIKKGCKIAAIKAIIRFLTLLQLSAHAGQAGLQAGRAVVEQHLDLSVADAEAVRIADGGGEQAQPLVHWQGRVNARLADVWERAGGCGLEHRVDLLWFGWITEILYILSIVILYIRLVEDNRISLYQTPAEPRLCCGSMPQVLY